MLAMIPWQLHEICIYFTVKARQKQINGNLYINFYYFAFSSRQFSFGLSNGCMWPWQLHCFLYRPTTQTKLHTIMLHNLQLAMALVLLCCVIEFSVTLATNKPHCRYKYTHTFLLQLSLPITRLCIFFALLSRTTSKMRQ